MANSFYYFFSSTPQVLGGILALFGVFVVFKIQNSKTVLFGIGQSIFDLSNERFRMQFPGLDASTTSDIIGFIQKGDTNGLYNTVKKISSESYLNLKIRYISVYDNLQKLIKRTILWSIITTMTIIICLSAIPFSSNILNHLQLFYTIIGVTLILVVICFGGLIYILINVLKE
jgi:hypothetical protein